MLTLYVLLGPTAVGKTEFALRMAESLGCPILNCDSRQIYRGMDIGTAKPTEEEKDGVVHHMMDFLEPSVNFSVADYCEMAHKVIEDIHSRGKMPILVGGTGLYLKALLYNYEFKINNDNTYKLYKNTTGLSMKIGSHPSRSEITCLLSSFMLATFSNRKYRGWICSNARTNSKNNLLFPSRCCLVWLWIMDSD